MVHPADSCLLSLPLDVGVNYAAQGLPVTLPCPGHTSSESFLPARGITRGLAGNGPRDLLSALTTCFIMHVTTTFAAQMSLRDDGFVRRALRDVMAPPSVLFTIWLCTEWAGNLRERCAK